MVKIIPADVISKIIDQASDEVLINSIEEGFVAYSMGLAEAPPGGHLNFTHPPGDVHIKFGYVRNDDLYIIKIASGFYNNPMIDISSSNGMMIIFCIETGKPLAILLDQGYLTNIRTAIAGAIAAKYLASPVVHCIGIIGTGIQARLQLKFLRSVTSCKNVMVWGRNAENAILYKNDDSLREFNIAISPDINYLAKHCNLIVTTTPSSVPLLSAEGLQPGTHITAVGADATGKHEIAPGLFGKAGIVVADSKKQCINHGDISYAISGGTIKSSQVHELGEVISNKDLWRGKKEHISIADLTGVAVQDIQIAKFVYNQIISGERIGNQEIGIRN